MEIKGFSILEAVSDTRRWEQVIEDLEREEARYMKLMELQIKYLYMFILKINGEREKNA